MPVVNYVLPNLFDGDILTITDFVKRYSANTGNLVYFYAYQLLIDEKFIVVKEYIADQKRKNPVYTKQSVVLYILANILGKQTTLSSKSVSGFKLTLPTVLVGLGCQGRFFESLDSVVLKETLEWLTLVSRFGKGKNIGIRGKITERFLSKHGFEEKLEVLGCPSLLIHKNPHLGREIYQKYILTPREKRKTHFAIASSAMTIPEAYPVERLFIKLATTHKSLYIVQSPAEMISLVYGWDVSESYLSRLQETVFTGFSINAIQEWFFSHATVFTSVPEWIDVLRDKTFFVGTRIHGVIAALSAGTPAVCLYIDLRTKELCEFMQIPHASVSEFTEDSTLEDFFAVFEAWDYVGFDANRVHIAKKILAFFEENGLNPSDHLKNLCQ